MQLSDFYMWVSSNLLWSLVSKFVIAMIPVGATAFVLRKAFRLKAFRLLGGTKEVVWYVAGLTVAIFVSLVASDHATRPLPQLTGTLHEIYLTPVQLDPNGAQVILSAKS
jgi:hypothetical protein